LRALIIRDVSTFHALTPARANDDIVCISNLPITDASTLLVAHANGHFEDAGVKVAPPMLKPRLNCAVGH
jgi:hypothetical protein